MRPSRAVAIAIACRVHPSFSVLPFLCPPVPVPFPAISAQRHNHKKHIPRVVDLSFHEYDRGEWFFIVEDHGSGLSRETLKAFATFGLSRKARNMERDNTDPDAPVFLSGEIGEFGVGSKQAAFFNGRCISVITAQDTDKPCSSSVLELEIAADRMDEAYEQSQNPYAGQVNQRARGNVDQSHLSAALLQRDSIRDLIVKRETTLRQFTRIIVSQVIMQADTRCGLGSLLRAVRCVADRCCFLCVRVRSSPTSRRSTRRGTSSSTNSVVCIFFTCMASAASPRNSASCRRRSCGRSCARERPRSRIRSRSPCASSRTTLLAGRATTSPSWCAIHR